jgi:hypothetical protein
LALYREELREQNEIAKRSNQVAEATIRDILECCLLLKDTRAWQRPDPKAKEKLSKMVESGVANFFNQFLDMNGGVRIVKEKQRRENEENKRIHARKEYAKSLLHLLRYEDLLQYHFDYKLKGPDYALSKWSKTIPKIKLKVAPKREGL